MTIRLHANATTTPKIRLYIQQSDKSHEALAKELGISVDTVRRWRKREEVHDRSHTAHRLQTTLTEAQEAVVVELRRSLLLPLTTYWSLPVRLSIPRFLGLAWTDVCVVMAFRDWPTWSPGRKNPSQNPRLSKAMSLALSMSISSTSPRCGMRPRGGTCS